MSHWSLGLREKHGITQIFQWLGRELGRVLATNYSPLPKKKHPIPDPDNLRILLKVLGCAKGSACGNARYISNRLHRAGAQLQALPPPAHAVCLLLIHDRHWTATPPSCPIRVDVMLVGYHSPCLALLATQWWRGAGIKELIYFYNADTGVYTLKKYWKTKSTGNCSQASNKIKRIIQMQRPTVELGTRTWNCA